MNKQIYLIRGTKDETYAGFQNRIQEAMTSVLKDNQVSRLSFTHTTEAPPKLSIIPFKKKKIAAISVWKETAGLINAISSLEGFIACYSVTEALPVAYQKTWKDGDRTPGICLLTLFKQKKRIDYKTFIHRWHNSHTPLSLKIHPLWHYNRNVVEAFVPNTTENWGGIVEEHMQTRSELLNPFKFFGNALVIIPRMLEVYKDTKSFIDYPSMEPYLVQEYVVKS